MASAPKDVKIRAGLLQAFENHTARFVPPYADRMLTSWELMDLAERLSKVKVPGFEPGEADVVLYGTAARGHKTYRALLYLCSLGFGPQAMMLARSLIEDALTARWTELHSDDAIERIVRHEKHMAYVFSETLKERKLDLGDLANLEPLTEDELKAAIEDFGKYGQRPWTGHRGLVELSKDLDEDWGDENERYLLGHVCAIHLRYVNLTLHNTAVSIAKPSYPNDVTAAYDAGESEDGIAGALMVGFWAFAHLFRVILRGELRDEFEAFYEQNMQSFIRET